MIFSMIKSCSWEAREGIYDTTYLTIIIHHNQGVDGIMVHFFPSLYYLCIFANCLWIAGHNRLHGCSEEIFS